MGLSPTTSESARLPAELDELTLARAQRGDPAAQTAFIERYQRPVFALLSRMLGRGTALVEDLAQETFLRALRALPDFDLRGPARPGTWVLTIATRLALDERRWGRPRGDLPGILAPPAVLARPDQDLHRRRVGIELARAVEGLGPAFRAAFLLREVHGLSYEEIAQELAIDAGTVKSRLSRARSALRAALVDFQDE